MYQYLMCLLYVTKYGECYKPHVTITKIMSVKRRVGMQTAAKL